MKRKVADGFEEVGRVNYFIWAVYVFNSIKWLMKACYLISRVMWSQVVLGYKL